MEDSCNLQEKWDVCTRVAVGSVFRNCYIKRWKFGFRSITPIPKMIMCMCIYMYYIYLSVVVRATAAIYTTTDYYSETFCERLYNKKKKKRSLAP